MESDPFGVEYLATGTYKNMEVHGLKALKDEHRDCLSGTYLEEPEHWDVEELAECETSLIKTLQNGMGCLVFPDGEAVMTADIKETVFTSPQESLEPALVGSYKHVLVATTKNLYVYLVNLHTLSSVPMHQISIVEEDCFTRRVLGARFGPGKHIFYMESGVDDFITLDFDLD